MGEFGRSNNRILYLRNQEVILHRWRQQEWAAEYFIPDVAWQSQVSIYMCHLKNDSNHEENSCGISRFIYKPFRIVLRVAMNLRERLIQGQLFVRAGSYQGLDFVLCCSYFCVNINNTVEFLSL